MKQPSVHSLLACLCAACALTACSDDNQPDDTGAPLQIQVQGGSTSIATFKAVRLTADCRGGACSDIRWTLGDSLLGTSDTLEFIATEAGPYAVTATARLSDGSSAASLVTLTATHPQQPYSAEVAEVTDYCPAPGQFVNKMPAYADGDTPQTMNGKALQAIRSGGVVTLGSYGGYMVCAFDHTVPNLPGNDLRIEGNSFAGNSEPGIVSVAFDRNRNGRPDADEWYELAGSEHRNGRTTSHYTVTYRRPASDHTPTPSATDPYITDDTYIAWADNRGATGYMGRNQFNTNDYFPAWMNAGELTFSGTLLPGNAVNNGTAGAPSWVLNALEYGYADNLPNAQSLFDISLAADENGHPVHLPGIDFVRIQTGMLQFCGWIGETSTEVGRIVDLHMTNP